MDLLKKKVFVSREYLEFLKVELSRDKQKYWQNVFVKIDTEYIFYNSAVVKYSISPMYTKAHLSANYGFLVRQAKPWFSQPFVHTAIMRLFKLSTVH